MVYNIFISRFTGLDYRGHFSHIFVDEAAFATEPETIVPLVGQMDENTQVILAGDPKQLDPVIKSEQARDAGYGKTLSLLRYHNYHRLTSIFHAVMNWMASLISEEPVATPVWSGSDSTAGCFFMCHQH